jgi:hypothetical protein
MTAAIVRIVTTFSMMEMAAARALRLKFVVVWRR